MDLRDDTLSGLLETLASKNQVLSWNLHKQKSGHIMVKIRFGDRGDQILDSEPPNSEFNAQSVTYKKVSENQNIRNFHRARSFKKQNPSKRARRENSDDSTELPRNENIAVSNSTPRCLDISECSVDSPCLPDQSVNHEQLVQSEAEHDSLNQAELYYDAASDDDSLCNHATLKETAGDAEENHQACSGANAQTPCVDGSQVKPDDTDYAWELLRTVLDGDDVGDDAMTDAWNIIQRISKTAPNDPARQYYESLLYDNHGEFKPGFKKLGQAHRSGRLKVEG